MAATDIIIQREPGYAVLRFSSPAGLNRLGTELLDTLFLHTAKYLADPELRCLVIQGVGGSFAVGADLNEILNLDPASARLFSDLGNSIFRAIERSSTAVIAAIDGYCLGGGLDLALAADWRISTQRSVFGHPGADLGVITGFGGTQRLSRLIGHKKSLEMFFSARRVKAQEAYLTGLVQELCSEEDFESRLTARIEHFLNMESSSIGDLKSRLIDLPPVGCAPLEGPWTI